MQPSGLILPEFDNAVHVGNYPYDPSIPLEIAVDPGYGGAYAVLAIQIKESQPYIVDEIYLQGYTTEDIVEVVKRKEWGSRIVAGAIDVAGRQHQAWGYRIARHPAAFRLAKPESTRFV